METVAYFGIAALEKLQACGNGTKEVPHGQRGAFGRSCRAHLRDLPVGGMNLGTLFCSTMATEQGDLGYGGNACQSLAAKAQGADMLQIVNLRYLAGCMACQCHLQLIRRDARAIVDDTNKLQDTIHQVNANLPCSRVDTILDKFFDNGCWPLNDFSRGNFRGYVWCKLAYWHRVSFSEYKKGTRSIVRTSVLRRL